MVTVIDENGVPVSAAQLTLTSTEGARIVKGGTDHTGRFEFENLAPGRYQLRVEKEGFYVVTSDEPRVGETQAVEITLNHLQELHEVMNVDYSPPAIDPEKTTSSEGLTGQDIVNLPYPTTRDIRQALPLIPGVLPDATGQIHVNGAATYQIFDLLDGFNITHPVTGLLDLRVSADAVRSVNIQDSRIPVEYGKSSGAVLSMLTGMGDDHFRFSATNFVPSLQTRKGVNFNEWTPRATFSGPLKKGKVWFFDALDGEYDLNIVDELPVGADRTHAWRWSNLAKAQINLSPANILTASVLINQFHSPNFGLSLSNPLPSTIDQRQSAYLATINDQIYFRNGMLLEVGMAVNQFRTDDAPQSGGLPFLLHPEGATGSFFQTDHGEARRFEWKANVTLPPMQWHGRHEFKVGTDIDHVTYQQALERQPISIVREDGTLARLITFVGNPSFRRTNSEWTGYVQDRWSLSDRLLLEIGIRQDWDQIIRDVLISPRLASTYLLTPDGRTKLSVGIGLYHDATNLDFVTRPLGGQRIDETFAADGLTPLGPPVLTAFLVNEQALKAPRFLNWSIGLERTLPHSVDLGMNFIERRGTRGFAFVNTEAIGTGGAGGQFLLTNEGQDHFDEFQINVRHTFKGSYSFLASYTRSAARSNAVVDFNLGNPVFSQQAGGPLPWDSPNRFLSWGGYPLIKGFDLFYSLDWRTGFPFSVIDQNQFLVGAPNSRRLPDFFSLNLHMERRFHLLGYYLALRAGFNNITNHQNAAGINNNVDSPGFSSLNGVQGRVFTARIRFLGRK
ncbi:MAG: TonB-dependent receptor [Acidobacteriia bacterium]|nr:TonB-dependent receptor [Terriglobia bacterium]